MPLEFSLTFLCFLIKFFFGLLNHSICFTKYCWSKKKKKEFCCSFLPWCTASTSSIPTILNNSLTSFYLKTYILCFLYSKQILFLSSSATICVWDWRVWRFFRRYSILYMAFPLIKNGFYIFCTLSICSLQSWML